MHPTTQLLLHGQTGETLRAQGLYLSVYVKGREDSRPHANEAKQNDICDKS